MNLSSLYKQLKKRLRQKRRWLSLGFFIVAATAAVLALQSYRGAELPKPDATQTWAARSVHTEPAEQMPAEALEAMRRIGEGGGQRTVYMRKAYVCGEESHFLGRMDAQDAAKLYGEHPHWSVDLQDEETVTFIETIDDLSESCKTNAYFGIDSEGNLSLFDGRPEEKQVIRTFFQMNIEYLESSLQQEIVDQLRRGIRVMDMEAYNSVLSTFSEFAVEASEKVMMPSALSMQPIS